MGSGDELLGWAVVANVQAETAHGHGGSDVQRGLKHFTAGTKVWVLPPQWGDGWEQVVVVGRHRGARRVVQMVIDIDHLTDFRVQGVYRPAVDRALRSATWDDRRGATGDSRQWSSEAEARDWIATHPATRDRLA